MKKDLIEKYMGEAKKESTPMICRECGSYDTEPA